MQLLVDFARKENGEGQPGLGGTVAFLGLAVALLAVLFLGIHPLIDQITGDTIKGLNSIATTNTHRPN